MFELIQFGTGKPVYINPMNIVTMELGPAGGTMLNLVVGNLIVKEDIVTILGFFP